MNHLSEDDDGGENSQFRLQYGLTAGETYILCARFYSNEITGEIPVIVTKDDESTDDGTVATGDIVSFSLQPDILFIDEFTKGEYVYDGDGEYFRYNLEYLFHSVQVETSDGEIINCSLNNTGCGPQFQFGDTVYNLRFYDDQSYYNQWQAGGNYIVTVEIGGTSLVCDVGVEIFGEYAEPPAYEAYPIGIEVDPITIDGLKGVSLYGEEGSRYFHYNFWHRQIPAVKLLMSDGEVVECPIDTSGPDICFEYNDQVYYPRVSSDQTYENRWLIGETYTAKIEVMGYETEFEVTIGDAEELVLDEDKEIEYRGYDEYFFAFTPEKSAIYSLKSFEEINDPYASIYNSDMEELAYAEDNNGLNFNLKYYLGAGETYYFRVYIRGEDGVCNVRLSEYESPIESITFEPISILESTCGGWVAAIDNETGLGVSFYEYYWWNNLSYTVTTTDGEEFGSSGADFWYDDEGHWFNYDSSSLFYEDRWLPNNTYYVEVSLYGETYEVPVTITESPVESIEFNPVTVYEGLTDGYWTEYWGGETDEVIEYYDYYLENNLSYTVTMKDGTVINGNGTWFGYNDMGYNIDWFDNQYEVSGWKAGNTYTATAEFMGESYDITVNVEENPVEKIEFAPITLTDRIDGYWFSYCDDETGEEYEYYRYSYKNKLSYTITLKNGETISGTTVSGDEPCVEFNGKNYFIESESNQSYENQWTVGNTYTVPISVLGFDTEVEITIEEMDVPEFKMEEEQEVTISDAGVEAYLTFTPVEDGTYIFESIPCYEKIYARLYDSKMRDVTGTYGGFRMEVELQGGEKYYLSTWHEYYGQDYSYSVKVTKLPEIVAIEIGDVEIYENTHGYMMEADDGSEYYYYSNWHWQIPSLKVIMSDGNEYDAWINRGNSEFSFEVGYEDYYRCHYPEITVTQDEDNRWTAGNTYTATVSVDGVEAQVNISIVETPIESISVKPISITEKTKGYYTEDWNDDIEDYQEYYRYSWWENLSYTIKLKDGTEITDEGRWFEAEDGNEYEIDCQDNQGFENQWIAGEKYTPTISIWGYTVEVPVTIMKAPVIESISVEPISIIENTGGYWYSHGDDEFIEGMEDYFVYRWWENLTYTVTFEDGTEVNGTDSGFEYSNNECAGVWYDIAYNTNQSHENYWTVGTHIGIFTVLGYTAEVPVTITENPVVSVDVEPIAIPAETNGYWEYHNEDEEDEEKYFIYFWDSYLSCTVKFKDGTTQKIGNTFEYGGKEYNVICDDGQWYPNHWLPGGTYVGKVSVMGVEAPVEITILDQNIENGIKYMVQNGEAIVIGVLGSGEVLTIPDTLGECPVTAITSLEGSEYTEIIIPDSVTSISNDMIYNCYSLEKITIGAGVTFLKNAMFQYSDDLKEIAVSEGNNEYVSIDGIVYDKAVTKMVAIPNAKTTKHTVPASVTDIDLYIKGSYRFEIDLSGANTGYIQEDGILYNAEKTIIYSCDSSKEGEYTMPDTVTKITDKAFMNSSLSEVTVSNNVSEIVYYAFAESINLEKVVLPDSLTTISQSAFEGCENLVDITLPSQLETLGQRSFANSGIKRAHIPSGVLSVGYEAFCNSGLEEVTFAEGVREIESLAFAGTNITDVKLPDSMRSLYSYAFSSSLIETIDLGNGLAYIGIGAFENSNLKALDIPESVEFIGERAFRHTKIQNLQIAEGVSVIEEHAFAGIEIESLNLPESVTDITYKCFENSRNLMNIDLPDSLESLDGYAFHGSAWYESQPDGVVYLENALYHYKGNMPENTEIVVKNGTKIIADYAFSDYDNLKSVTIPKSVKYIGESAFANCNNLKTIYYAGNEADRDNLIVGHDNKELFGAKWHYGVCAHDWKDATCTEPKICSVCGETEGAALGHDMAAATCKVPSTCKRCKTHTIGSKLEHNWDSGKVTKKATCNAKGTKTFTCTVCDDTKTEAIPKTTSHSYKTTTIKATTSEKGKIVKKCTVCDEVESTTTISKIKSIELSEDEYVYNGKSNKPTIIIKDSKGKKIASKYYTVSGTKSAKKVGKYKITVKFKDRYSGTKTLYYTINPKPTSISKVTAAKKSLKVTIKKQSTQVTGYVIQYSTSKKFTSAKTKTIKSYKTTSLTLKSLKGKKTYYVRVRTYKTVNGKKYYSAWSAAKSKKTK